MTEYYSLDDLNSALIRNFEIYLDEGKPYELRLCGELFRTDSKEHAMKVYQSTLAEFKDKVYCAINEDYWRMNRHNDLLKRWEEAENDHRTRNALERLIINFDLDNYSDAPKKSLFG